MRFLLDLNTGGTLVEWLARRGHDAIAAGAHDVSISDEAILRWAVQDHRIIVTTDRDFEEMIFQRGLRHCGLIRIPNDPRVRRFSILEQVLIKYAAELQNKSIILVEAASVRIRNSGGSGTN